MHCVHCGKEIMNGALFCQFCGKELKKNENRTAERRAEPMKMPPRMNRPAPHPAPGNTKRLMMLLVGFLVLAVISIALGIGAGVYANYSDNSANRHLSLGDRYLSNLRYEEAVAAYQAAIDIDPMNVKAYQGLADAYVGLRDYENAMDALYTGYKTTSDTLLMRKEADICLAYIELLDEQGEKEKIIVVLNERSAQILDDRIREIKEKYVSERTKPAPTPKPTPIPTPEPTPEPDDDSWEACIAKREELASELGTGFWEGAVIEDFLFYDENGNAYRISDFAGKTVYINFFTTWCPYCYYELPDMQRVNSEYNNDEALVIMIDLNETVNDAKNYVAQYGITMPIFYIDSWQVGSLSVEGVPLSIVIDRYGVIHGMNLGMSDYAWMSSTMSNAYNNYRYRDGEF